MDSGGFDIYGDLENFDISQKLKEKNEEFNSLQEKYNSAIKQIEKLETERMDLKQRMENMERSLSSLLVTARTELKRKETQINELRKEKDDICFRRNNRGSRLIDDSSKHVRRYENNNDVGRHVKNPFVEKRNYEKETSRATTSPRRNGHHRSDNSKTRDYEDREKDRYMQSNEHEVSKRDSQRKHHQSQERRTEKGCTDTADLRENKRDLSNTRNSLSKSVISRGRDRDRSDEMKYWNRDKVSSSRNETSNNHVRLKARTSRHEEEKNSRNQRRDNSCEHSSTKNIRNSETPQPTNREERGKRDNNKEMEISQSQSREPSKMTCISIDDTNIRRINFEENKTKSSSSSETSRTSKKIEGRITLSEYRHRKEVTNRESSPQSHKDESHTKIDTQEDRNISEASSMNVVSPICNSLSLNDRQIAKNQNGKGTFASIKSQKEIEEIDVANKNLDKQAEIVGQSSKFGTIQEKSKSKLETVNSISGKDKQTFEDILFDEIVSQGTFKNCINNSKEENENRFSDDERLYIDLEEPNESPIQIGNLNDSRQEKKSATLIKSGVQTPSCKEPGIFIAEDKNKIYNDECRIDSGEKPCNKMEKENLISKTDDENMKESENIQPRSLCLKEISEFSKEHELNQPEEGDLLPQASNYASNDNNREKSDKLYNADRKSSSEVEELYVENISKSKETDPETEEIRFTPPLEPGRSSTPTNVPASKYFGDQNTQDATEANDSLNRNFSCVESQLEYIFRDTLNKSLEGAHENISNPPLRNDTENIKSELEITPKNIKSKAQEMFDLYLGSPTNVIPTEIEKRRSSKERTPPGQIISGTKKRKSSTPRKSPALNGRGMKLIGHRIEGFEPGIHGVKALEASKLKNALFKDALGSEIVIEESLVTNSSQEDANALSSGENTSLASKDSNNIQKNVEFNFEEGKLQCAPELKNVQNSAETYLEKYRKGDNYNTGTEFEGVEELSPNDCNNVKASVLIKTSEGGEVLLGALMEEDTEDTRTESLHKNKSVPAIAYENKEIEENVSVKRENVEEKDSNKRKRKENMFVEGIGEEKLETATIIEENSELDNGPAEKSFISEKIKDSDAKMESSKKEDHMGIIPGSTDDDASYSPDTVVNSDSTKGVNDFDNNSKVEENLARNSSNMHETSFEQKENVSGSSSSSKVSIKEKIEILSIITIKSNANNLEVNTRNAQHCDDQCSNEENPKNNSKDKSFVSSVNNNNLAIDHDLDDEDEVINMDTKEEQNEIHSTKTESSRNKDIATIKTTAHDNETFSNHDNHKQTAKSFKEPLAPDELFDINPSQNSRQYYSEISSPEGFSNSPRDMTRSHLQNRSSTSQCNPFVKLDAIIPYQQSYTAENLKRNKGKGIKKFVEDFCKSIESVDEETVSDSINSYMSDHEASPVSSNALSKRSLNFGSAIMRSGDGQSNIFASSESIVSKISKNQDREYEENAQNTVLLNKSEESLEDFEKFKQEHKNSSIENVIRTTEDNESTIPQRERSDFPNMSDDVPKMERELKQNIEKRNEPGKHEKVIHSLEKRERKSRKKHAPRQQQQECPLSRRKFAAEHNSDDNLNHYKTKKIVSFSLPLPSRRDRSDSQELIEGIDAGNSVDRNIRFESDLNFQKETDKPKSDSIERFDSHSDVSGSLSPRVCEHEKPKTKSKRASNNPKLEDEKSSEPFLNTNKSQIENSQLEDTELTTRRISNKRRATDAANPIEKSKRQKLHDHCSNKTKTEINLETPRREPGELSATPNITQESETASAVNSILIQESNEDEFVSLPSLTKENIEKMQKCLVECASKAVVFTRKCKGRPKKIIDRNSRIRLQQEQEGVLQDSDQTTSVRKSSRIQERRDHGRYNVGMSICECCSKNISVKSKEICEIEVDDPCEKYSQTVQSKFIELFGNSPISSPASKEKTEREYKCDITPERRDSFSTINCERKENEQNVIEVCDKEKREEKVPCLVSNTITDKELIRDSIEEDFTSCTPPKLHIQESESIAQEVQLGLISNPSDLSRNSQRSEQNKSPDKSSLKRPFPEENCPVNDDINNITIFNDSGGERKNISTTSADYVIEAVSSSVVNVFITRKKRRKR